MYSDLAYQQILMPERYHTVRHRTVDSVVIHYAAGIVKEAKDVVGYWLTKDYTGANYIIDVQGRITNVVPEEQRAYTTGTFYNAYSDDIDDHAITIECSCDSEDYHVSGMTIDALCRLMADIGCRYGIWWRFTGDKTGNMHAHKWYQATPCPGEYLYSKFPLIQDIANYIQYKKEENDLDSRLENLEQEVNDHDILLQKHVMPFINSLNDVPEWAKGDIQYLVDIGIIKGTDNGWQLSMDMLRNLCFLSRALRSDHEEI